MNMSITESDKRLLGFLAAFLVVIIFWMFVFKPLTAKNQQLEKDVQQAIEQEQAQEEKASRAGEMTKLEVRTEEQLAKVLARFYPILQSQDAENMATTLALNHSLEIQSLTVSMPETEMEPDWYQYSRHADGQSAKPEEQKSQAGLPLYVARVTCVADGEEENLWALLDDISENYPAISIMNAEWSVVEITGSETIPTEIRPVSSEDGEDEDEDEGQVQRLPAVRTAEAVTTNRMTVTLEIYMCRQ